MTTQEVSLGKQVIADSERVSAELASERLKLRGFKPGDPDRERRIEAAMMKQAQQGLEILSVLGKARWRDDVLSEEEYRRLRELSADLSRHRRQLKKMRR